jgi:hypothetical protein
MTSRLNTVRKIAFVVTFAISVFSISTASHAYTAEQARLCLNDAFKFCPSDMPNVDKVTACLTRHAAQLSPGCKSLGPPPSTSASN